MTQSTHLRVATLVAAGLLATTHGIAHADTTTSGNGSIGGGNQVELDLDAPVNACGNSVAVLGLAGADCTGGDAKVTDAPSDPYPGYDDYEPEEDEEEEEEPEEEAPEESPEEEAPEESPEEEAPEGEEEDREEQTDEESSEQPSESASPSAPPADESRLAVTGADQSALVGLVAAAVLAVAAGAGLLLFGKRRRTRA
ncbi:hypothetical protein GCM10007079_02970 [Nocardiopsis terrae]|uniref:Outer membrane biosynthesis protein TonB n=1 Tax=Nocardiopsis terrae TaxID=372655 RepID=A0ABR9HMS9_9ACTN|nr:chaplin family protein [Nocardiopsis terrae]MBE1460347.1 outer membrane biosynthesis protein TonB [Nocardiopsis terrae]GHC70962.1 hypothetical protein GCM10007079_02970 [Nocardiopsis terrae]